MMETVTLVSPRAFTLNCDEGEHLGEVYKVNKGNTENFPAALVEHWYVKAHGAVALAVATSGEAPAEKVEEPAKPAAKPAKAAKAAPAATPVEPPAAPVESAAAAPWAQK